MLSAICNNKCVIFSSTTKGWQEGYQAQAPKLSPTPVESMPWPQEQPHNIALTEASAQTGLEQAEHAAAAARDYFSVPAMGS